VNAIIAGLAVAVIALTLAFSVVIASWWVRDRRRRRDREAARQARREIDERASRQLRLHLTPKAR
jgi:type II secretory pathway pseudopilin PulG